MPSAARLNVLRGFWRKYTEPLGPPRKKVAFDGREVTLEVNASGALGLVPWLIEVASGVLGDTGGWEGEPAEWDSLHGLWLGDLEPTSAILLFVRRGPREHLPTGFRYEPPSFQGGSLPSLGEGGFLSVRFHRVVGGTGSVHLEGHAATLLRLAEGLVYIAQPGAPADAKIRYTPESMNNLTSLPFVIRRTTIPPFDRQKPPEGKAAHLRSVVLGD